MSENGVCMSLTCVTRVSPHAFAMISIVVVGGGERKKILHVEIPISRLKTHEKKCQFPAELKSEIKLQQLFSPSLVRISFLPSDSYFPLFSVTATATPLIFPEKKIKNTCHSGKRGVCGVRANIAHTSRMKKEKQVMRQLLLFAGIYNVLSVQKIKFPGNAVL